MNGEMVLKVGDKVRIKADAPLEGLGGNITQHQKLGSVGLVSEINMEALPYPIMVKFERRNNVKDCENVFTADELERADDAGAATEGGA